MKRRDIVIITAISLSLLLIIISLVYKPSIHEADYFELISIHEIGDIKATKILDYLESNPGAEMAELVLVNGIGDKTIELLKRRFR